MSILIKGMEMPRSCEYCSFLVRKKGFIPYCEINQTLDVRSFDSNRLKGCPLTEIPTPHGRLIDAGKLHDCVLDIYGGCGDDMVVWYGDILRMVDDTPTIIEAEEG